MSVQNPVKGNKVIFTINEVHHVGIIEKVRNKVAEVKTDEGHTFHIKVSDLVVIPQEEFEEVAEELGIGEEVEIDILEDTIMTSPKSKSSNKTGQRTDKLREDMYKAGQAAGKTIRMVNWKKKGFLFWLMLPILLAIAAVAFFAIFVYTIKTFFIFTFFTTTYIAYSIWCIIFAAITGVLQILMGHSPVTRDYQYGSAVTPKAEE